MAFKECGSLISDSNLTCKEYLNQTGPINLTIIDQMTPIMLKTSMRNNYFNKSMITNSSFIVNKGYVPVVRKTVNNGELRINGKKDFLPDFTCLLNPINNQFFNISLINYTHTNGVIYYNAIYRFSYNTSDIFLANTTQILTFQTFGLHWIKYFSRYNGNFFSWPNYFVNIQQISSYPFQNI